MAEEEEGDAYFLVFSRLDPGLAQRPLLTEEDLSRAAVREFLPLQNARVR